MDSETSGGRRVRQARIERLLDHAPGTRSLWLRPLDGEPVRFTPGQFISCELPLGGPRRLPRPYSIASHPEDGHVVEICLDQVAGGTGSSYLFSLAIGTTVDFSGPFGFFTLDRPPQSECVMVAAGTCVAPMRPMIYRALAGSGENSLHLLHAAADQAHLLYHDEFRALAAEQERFRFEPRLLDAENELLGLVEERYVERDSERDRIFYVCTVGGLTLRLRDSLRHAGYPRANVHYEKW